ncbi:hypothetical protein CL622_04615 [archaeon]|nr:hypothetical protein [archaeon]|tara:strand:+ start:1399 stop:3276 length:1878 start_codon:yes stop_codon:yes gene_type:complete
MIGRIIGKTTTRGFTILLDSAANKRAYVQTTIQDKKILAQITEIERTKEQTLGYCTIVGYYEGGKLTQAMDAPEPNSEVSLADPNFIDETLGLSRAENGAFLGRLVGYPDVDVKLDVSKFLKTHTAVLAKTGGGKSFCIATIIEELIEKQVPIVIIDPHGEYHTLKEASTQTKQLQAFNIDATNYKKSVKEFSPDIKINRDAERLSLNQTNLSATDLIEMLPAKLSQTQMGIIYTALKEAESPSLDAVRFAIEMQEHPAKFMILNTIDYLKKLQLFSNTPTPTEELVKVGRTTIINLKGVPAEIQEITVHKLLHDLFEERKKGRIPPFFLVVEEAHNYIPERSYRQAKSSKILRQIFAEGRKFGIGACIVTQRPSRVEKNALSQVNTQLILRVTNPADVKAIASSSEGITETMEEDIKGLSVGVGMVVGAFELPVFVTIRPRKTMHGGESIDILKQIQSDKDKLPLIYTEKKENPILIPCVQLEYESNKVLVDLTDMKIVKNLKPIQKVAIPTLDTSGLSEQQMKIFKLAQTLDAFKAAEVFAQSELQFSDLYDILSVLEQKGLLDKEGEHYTAKKINIKDFSLNVDINFEQLEYDEIKDKKYSLEDIHKQFSTPDDMQECYLVT